MTIDDIMQELRPKLGQESRASRFFSRIRPSIRIGGQQSKSLYQFTLASPRHRHALPLRPRVGSENEGCSWPRRRHQRSANQESAGQCGGRSRQSIGLGSHADSRSKTLFTALTASDWSRPSIRRTMNTGCVLDVQNRFQSRSRHALGTLHSLFHSGQLVPLSAVSKFTTNVGPLTVNHTGQLPSVTISFNLGSRSRARPGRQRSAETRAVPCCPSPSTPVFKAAPRLSNSRSPVCGILLIMAVSRDLYRAWHSLRELHSPHHDSLRPSCRCFRRPAHTLSIFHLASRYLRFRRL